MSSLSDAYFIPINKLVRALWGREDVVVLCSEIEEDIV